MRGFTLIEVIVSLFIIGTAIVLTGTMLHTLSLVRHARLEDLATKIASNELESLRALGYASLPASGTFSDSLMATLPQGNGKITVTDYNASTKSVTAVVNWVDTGATASTTVSLTTLITKLGGL